MKTSASYLKNNKKGYKSSTKPLDRNNSEAATCTYKNLNHRMNFCKFNLSTDIEKNPGPTFIDPSKTIRAPYSQGNVDVFGPNAGQQCVAMSLCALIHNFRNKSVTHTISYPEHLVQIMNIGNELYSALSRLSRQSYLLLTELPTMVTVLNINYQLEFTESYSGSLHNATLNENIPYVMPLDCALQTLIQEGYISFLLTIGTIYTISNDVLKIFDSHSRDSFGMADGHGTCVLLEVNSINNLIEYFKNLHKSDVLFELKGVKITVAQFTQITNIHTNTSESNLSSCSSACDERFHDNFNSSEQCSVIMCFYSICFSTITAYNYWNDLTLSAIAEHAKLSDQEALNDRKEFTTDYMPHIINICGAAVDVVFNARHQGTLFSNSVSSKHVLEKLILDNTTENTGFLLWLSTYCLSCIFQHVDNKNQKTKYFLVASNEKQTINLFEKFNDSSSVINKICNIITQKLKCEEIEYNIQFISCSCQLTKSERQKIIRKHKSTIQKSLLADKSKENYHKWYANLEPAKKKRRSEESALNYY